MTVEKLPGILVHFEQRAAGTVFVKWSVVFGDDQKTTIVTASFPKSLEQKLSDQLKSCVLSVRPDNFLVSDSDSDLPFTVEPSPKLKLTPAISKILMYTKDGIIPAKSPEDPLFVVAPSISTVEIQDKKQFAEQRLRKIAQTQRVIIKSSDAITINGLDGYESLAEAEDFKSGVLLTAYQVIVFDKDSYILMQGLIGFDREDEYIPEFKSMARSLLRKVR